MSNQTRNDELAKIHIASKQLGMDRDTYEDALWTVCRVRSAKDLDAYGRKEFIKHLKSCGAKFKRKKRPTVAANKKAQVAKINAMLIAAGKKEAYADAIAKRMFKVEKFEWCTAEQLGKIIAAVAISNRKNGVVEE